MREKEDKGEGRLPENNERETKAGGGRDISEIDCQEGSMQRGETGGNFQENSDKHDNEKNPQ